MPSIFAYGFGLSSRMGSTFTKMLQNGKMEIAPSQIWANDQGWDNFLGDFDLRIEMVS